MKTIKTYDEFINLNEEYNLKPIISGISGGGMSAFLGKLGLSLSFSFFYGLIMYAITYSMFTIFSIGILMVWCGCSDKIDNIKEFIIFLRRNKRIKQYEKDFMLLNSSLQEIPKKQIRKKFVELKNTKLSNVEEFKNKIYEIYTYFINTFPVKKREIISKFIDEMEIDFKNFIYTEGKYGDVKDFYLTQKKEEEEQENW